MGDDFRKCARDAITIMNIRKYHKFIIEDFKLITIERLIADLSAL